MPPVFQVSPQMIDYWVSQLGTMAAIIFAAPGATTHQQAANDAIRLVDALVTECSTQGVMYPLYTEIRTTQKP